MNKKTKKKLTLILTKNEKVLSLVISEHKYLKHCAEKNRIKKRKVKLRLKDLKRFWYLLPWNKRESFLKKAPLQSTPKINNPIIIIDDKIVAAKPHKITFNF